MASFACPAQPADCTVPTELPSQCCVECSTCHCTSGSYSDVAGYPVSEMAERPSEILRCEECDLHSNSLQSSEDVFDPVNTRRPPGHHFIQIIATTGTLQCTCGENISDTPAYFLDLQINTVVDRLDNQVTSRMPCESTRPYGTTSDRPLEHLNPILDDRSPSSTTIPETIGTQSHPAGFLDPDYHRVLQLQGSCPLVSRYTHHPFPAPLPSIADGQVPFAAPPLEHSRFPLEMPYTPYLFLRRLTQQVQRMTSTNFHGLEPTLG
ncbi:hypothetical protein HOO65_020980 [Ceratocystis lukuohia]|uniref:Uncharacterized protein n=1 Tax=Ceratocystis lukuohia TaxID=2019550 RepID=A0ABR4MQ66_9PEZI